MNVFSLMSCAQNRCVAGVRRETATLPDQGSGARPWRDADTVFIACTRHGALTGVLS